MFRFHRSANWLLTIPVLLYLVLSLLYLLAIPVGESPDEPGHMQCIAQVAQTGRLPDVDPLYVGDNWWGRQHILSNHMCYHMPVYYLIAGNLHRVIAGISDEPLAFKFPPTNPKFDTGSVMFLHETKSSFWEVTEPVSVVGLRLFSIALGLILLLGTYVVARRVFVEQPLVAVLATTMVAGWPQFVYMSRAINNDALATVLAVLTLLVLMNVGRPYRFLGAAVLSSLAVLTKLSMGFVIVAVLAGWVFEVLQSEEEKRPYLNALFASLVIWAGTFSLMGLHPVIGANLRQSLTQFSGVVPASATLPYWQQIYVWTLNSGWAWFGWLSVKPPAQYAQIWWLMIELTIIVGVYWVLKRPLSKKQRNVLLVLGVWWLGITLTYVRINTNRWQPQFRFAWTVLPLLATFSAGGWLSRLKEHRIWQYSIIMLFAGMLLAFNIWLVFGLVGPTYQYWPLS